VINQPNKDLVEHLGGTQSSIYRDTTWRLAACPPSTDARHMSAD
jgi:hypothetical protein